MNDVFICHVAALRPDYKPGDVSQWETVLTFVAPVESRAQYLAGEAAQAFSDATGRSCNWHVEPLPYVFGPFEAQIYRLAREAAQG